MIIYNILLLLFVLIFFEVLGNLVSKKIFGRSFTINIPVGFITYMAFFQIINTIPLVLHVSYSFEKIVVLPLTIIFAIFLIYKNGANTFNDIKKVEYKYLCIIVIVTMILGIFYFFEAEPMLDSWLFMPLSLSSIQNDIMYSNSGMGSLTNYYDNHYTDSYYLFQSVMASMSRIDPSLYLMSWYKIFEISILVSTFAILLEVVVPKYKNGILFLFGITILFGISIFTAYITYDEILFHLGNMSATGTMMLNSTIVSLLFVYYILKDSKNNNILFWVLITFAAFSFTSSSAFVLGIFIFVAITSDILVYKTKDYLFAYVVSIFIIFNYLLLWISTSIENYIVSLFGVLFTIIFIIIVKKIIYVLNMKLIIKIFKIFITLYIFTILLIFISQDNTISTIVNVFKFDRIANYTYGFYNSIYTNMIVLFISIMGIIRIYKTRRDIFAYLAVVFLLAANIVMFSTIGDIISQDVYHRVFILLMLNVVTINGFIYIYEILNRKYIFKFKYFCIIISLLIVSVFNIPFSYKINQFDSFSEYKVGNSDLYELINYDYPASNKVSTSHVYKQLYDFNNPGVEQIFKYRADLEKIDYCQSDCYDLYFLGESSSGTIVLTTENYELVYKE